MGNSETATCGFAVIRSQSRNQLPHCRPQHGRDDDSGRTEQKGRRHALDQLERVGPGQGGRHERDGGARHEERAFGASLIDRGDGEHARLERRVGIGDAGLGGEGARLRIDGG